MVRIILSNADKMLRIIFSGYLQRGKSLRQGLFFHKLPSSGGSYFPWRSIWKVNVPLRFFFWWMTALGKILTLDNMRKTFFLSNIVYI